MPVCPYVNWTGSLITWSSQPRKFIYVALYTQWGSASSPGPRRITYDEVYLSFIPCRNWLQAVKVAMDNARACYSNFEHCMGEDYSLINTDQLQAAITGYINVQSTLQGMRSNNLMLSHLSVPYTEHPMSPPPSGGVSNTELTTLLVEAGLLWSTILAVQLARDTAIGEALTQMGNAGLLALSYDDDCSTFEDSFTAMQQSSDEVSMIRLDADDHLGMENIPENCSGVWQNVVDAYEAHETQVNTLNVLAQQLMAEANIAMNGTNCYTLPHTTLEVCIPDHCVWLAKQEALGVLCEQLVPFHDAVGNALGAIGSECQGPWEEDPPEDPPENPPEDPPEDPPE